MQIILAKPSGFCGGVHTTIEQLKEILSEHKQGPVYCYNYPVHNMHVIQELEALGLIIIKDLSEIKQKGILAISAHGAAPSIIEKAKALGMQILDTTCPKVTVAQEAARKLYINGYRLFILGDQNHSEVKGIAGFCDGHLEVINSIDQLPAINLIEKIGLIAQTTQNQQKFDEAVQKIEKMTSCLMAINTICPATHSRQTAALEISQQVDLMIIIGDTKSANTKRLLELCQDAKTNSSNHAVMIQSADDLEPKWFQSINKVGITAGASTPREVIDKVIEKISVIRE